MKLVTKYLPKFTGIIKSYFERKISELEPSMFNEQSDSLLHANVISHY